YHVTILAWDRKSTYPLLKQSIELPGGKTDIYRVRIKAGIGNGMKNIPNLIKFQICIRPIINTHQDFEIVHGWDFDTAFTEFHSINHTRRRFVYDIFDYYVD
ncbi:hypothetical protein WNX12_10770, partial [Limosilactobacillus fermentum]|uniref:hypothetical protein n=1 Tax=Limosilactobacillus fermentum TaxID=1613 RepID=UPI0030EA5E81